MRRQQVGPAGGLLARLGRRPRMGGGPAGDDLVVAAAGRRVRRVDIFAPHRLLELPEVHRGLEDRQRIRRRRGRHAEELVHRLEAAQDEPHLVALRVARPGAAEDDQLHLVDRMPGVAERAQPRESLPVGVELVLRGALGARLGRQVALRHPHVAGTEDAPARARVGLGQHGHRRDAAAGADRLHPHPVDERPLARRTGPERPVAADQLALGEEALAVLRVAAEQLVQVAGLEPRRALDGADDRLEFRRVLARVERVGAGAGAHRRVTPRDIGAGAAGDRRAGADERAGRFGATVAAMTGTYYGCPVSTPHRTPTQAGDRLPLQPHWADARFFTMRATPDSTRA